MFKIAKTKNYLSLLLLGVIIVLIAACSIAHKEEQVTPVQETPLSLNKYINNVIVAEKTPSTIVYEYANVRVDEVALLAAMYCQDNGNRNAYLEKVNLYKNNKRRAWFYCSSK